MLKKGLWKHGKNTSKIYWYQNVQNKKRTDKVRCKSKIGYSQKRRNNAGEINE